MSSDKQIELNRYDARASSKLSAVDTDLTTEEFGSASMPDYLRTPYICYEIHAKNLITSQHKVLELGAGSGLHTWALVQSGAKVICTDISPNSLKVLAHQYASRGIAVETQVADIEKLPFPDDSFDVVASAGCLSYGQPALVDAEIRRVLRAGGMFICVDSLNHNPIYRLNRLLHYWRGNRTWSTLQHMPDLARIRMIGCGFSNVTQNFFGSLSYLMPVVAKFVGAEQTQRISDYFDGLIGARRSAFKFVLVAKDLQKSVSGKRV